MNLETVRREIADCLERAEKHYGFTESVEVKYDLRGRNSGQARYDSFTGKLTLRLNSQLFTPEYSDELKNTIAHEVAHLVCYIYPRLGKNHDAGWRRVCIQLGGDGSRCHTLPLEKARKTRKAIYNVAGNEMHLGITRHKRIQQGKVYRCNRSGQRITQENFTGRIIKD